MHGPARPAALTVLDTFLLFTLGSPEHPNGWSWARPLRLAQAGTFDWLVKDLTNFGPVTVETELHTGVACVYTIVCAPGKRLVCYVATAAPWATVIAYSVGPDDGDAWVFDRVLTASATLPHEAELTRLLSASGFHLATEEELSADSPYRHLGRSLTYWALLFESEIDPPWEAPAT